MALQCLRAFNWEGFHDGPTFLGGLPVHVKRSIDVGDMAIVVHHAQLLGCEAVRLPFRYVPGIGALLSFFHDSMHAEAGL